MTFSWLPLSDTVLNGQFYGFRLDLELVVGLSGEAHSHNANTTLCAHFAFRQVLISIAINPVQTTLELLDRGWLEFSVLDQTRDSLQEHRKFSSVVVVETERPELEAVGAEYDRNCEGGLSVGFYYNER